MVDLPEPDGPTMATIEPFSISRSMFWSAVTLRLPSNCLETPRSWITTFYYQYNRNLTMRIGVDAGGTFTDFVVVEDNGRLSTFKLRSNPAAPARVILQGIEQAALGRSS